MKTPSQHNLGNLTATHRYNNAANRIKKKVLRTLWKKRVGEVHHLLANLNQNIAVYNQVAQDPNVTQAVIDNANRLLPLLIAERDAILPFMQRSNDAWLRARPVKPMVLFNHDNVAPVPALPAAAPVGVPAPGNP